MRRDRKRGEKVPERTDCVCLCSSSPMSFLGVVRRRRGRVTDDTEKKGSNFNEDTVIPVKSIE